MAVLSVDEGCRFVGQGQCVREYYGEMDFDFHGYAYGSVGLSFWTLGAVCG